MDFTEFNSQRTRAFPHHPALWGSRCLTVTSLKAANGDTKAVYTPEGCSEIEVSSWELLLLAKAISGLSLGIESLLIIEAHLPYMQE